MEKEQTQKTPLLILAVVFLILDAAYISLLAAQSFITAGEIEVGRIAAPPGIPLYGLFGAIFMAIVFFIAWVLFITIETLIIISRLKSGKETLDERTQIRLTKFSMARLIVMNIFAGIILIIGLVLFFIMLMPMGSSGPVDPSSMDTTRMITPSIVN